MRKLITILSILFSLSGNGQITINNNIIAKDGDTLTIQNLGNPKDSTNLISVKDIRENQPLFFSGSLVNDTFTVSIDSNLITLKKGLSIFISSSNENLNSLFLKVNGVNYNVKQTNGYSVYGGLVISQKICILIFNGLEFIFINSELPKCPSGFVQPNASYCIEQNERSGDFWTALTTCKNLGYRLCSWSEWYYACQKISLGMTGTINNWEWINNGQNEPTNGKVVGAGKCEITTHRLVTSSSFFRCCLSY